MQRWQQSTVKAPDTPLEAVLDHRDLLEVVQQQFAALGPEHVLRATELRDASGKRVYFRLNHGDWWLAAQASLQQQGLLTDDAVIIPIILYSDKTQCDDRKTVTERCDAVLCMSAAVQLCWPDTLVHLWTRRAVLLRRLPWQLATMS